MRCHLGGVSLKKIVSFLLWANCQIGSAVQKIKITFIFQNNSFHAVSFMSPWVGLAREGWRQKIWNWIPGQTEHIYTDTFVLPRNSYSWILIMIVGPVIGPLHPRLHNQWSVLVCNTTNNNMNYDLHLSIIKVFGFVNATTASTSTCSPVRA